MTRNVKTDVKTKKKPATKPQQAAVDKPAPEPQPKPAAETVLVLRSSDKSRISSHSFQWPGSGPVECTDWDPAPVCGHGLHGLLWGDGDWSLLNKAYDAVWQVVEVVADCIVPIDKAKVKFPRGTVIYSGGIAGAVTMVLNHQKHFTDTLAAIQAAAKKTEASKSGKEKSVSAEGKKCAAASSGYSSKAASSGDSSKAASSGDSSTAASSGYYSTAASSGYYSTAASSGESSTAASSGYSSKAASSGESSTAASSGYYSTAASSGYYSTAASSGYYSTAASSGKNTVAMAAGLECRVKAGEDGCFASCYKDKVGRIRVLSGYVGEDGIKADTWYRIKAGKFIEA
jgi:hypothetical protein